MLPNASIHVRSHQDRKPVRNDVPHGEVTSQQQDARKRDTKGIQPRRVIELYKLNARSYGSCE